MRQSVRTFCGSLLPLILVAAPLALGAAPLARAQGETLGPVPESEQQRDINEVEEVDGSARAGRRMLADELSYTAHEIRGRSNYALSLGIGQTKPWQSYTLEAVGMARPDFVAGIYAGGGQFKSSGTTGDQKSYDMNINARGAGAAARYYFHRLDRLSVEGDLGLNAWGRAALAPWQ